MNKADQQGKTARRNRGVVLVCVIACLAIVSALLMLVCRNALTARRETRLRVQMQQTELLLDAGILRASQQSRRSADYVGETWQPSGAFSRYEIANVDIVVDAIDDKKQITVIASIGGTSSESKSIRALRTQRRHTFQP